MLLGMGYYHFGEWVIYYPFVKDLQKNGQYLSKFLESFILSPANFDAAGDEFITFSDFSKRFHNGHGFEFRVMIFLFFSDFYGR